MSEPRTGSTFAGHRLESVAGRGGMGIVYVATHLALERTVALKVIAPGLAEDPDFRERFQRESRTAASIRHPHVITVFHAGEEDGNLYITMEFIEGTDLRAMIKEGGPLPAEAAARIVSQVASGLDAAHARGLVHRDVKPGNVLVNKENGQPHAYLTDFGLTRRTDSGSALTRTGQFVGTPDYVAPEQITGDKVDERADIYSLGCVLYEALSGKVPYPGETEWAKLHAHINNPPPSLGRGVDRRLAAVVRTAMATDPEDRYQAAAAVREALAEVIDEHPHDSRIAPSRAGATVRAASAGVAERPSLTGEPAASTAAAEAMDEKVRDGRSQTSARSTSTSSPPPQTQEADGARRSTTRAETGRRDPGPRRPILSGLRQIGQLGRPALAALAGLGLAVMVGGVLLAAGSGSSGQESVGAANAELAYGHDWQQDLGGGRPVQGLDLKDTAALTYSPLSGAGLLMSGHVANPAPGADPVPAALRDQFTSPAKPVAVQLGGVQAISYDSSLKQSGPTGQERLRLYMVPTTRGYLAIACQAPVADFHSFGSSCEEVASSVEITGGDALPVGPSESYARELSSALRKLSSERTRADGNLKEAGTLRPRLGRPPPSPTLTRRRPRRSASCARHRRTRLHRRPCWRR